MNSFSHCHGEKTSAKRMQLPLLHLLMQLLHRFLTDGGKKVREALTMLPMPWLATSESIAEKVKGSLRAYNLLAGWCGALHYLGLLYIEFQTALFKATGQNFLQMFRLRLAHAMTYRVIGIAFKWYMRVMDAHPLVMLILLMWYWCRIHVNKVTLVAVECYFINVILLLTFMFFPQLSPVRTLFININYIKK